MTARPSDTLTKTAVEKLKPGAIAWDDKVAGFGVRRQRKVPVYILKARVRGRQRWITIGKHGSPWSVEKARAKAKALLGQIASGSDPAAARDDEKAAGTFSEFADRYMTDYAAVRKKPSSARMDAVNLRVNILPRLGKRRLTDITRADIAKLHHDLAHSKGAADRCLSLLSKMFNLAELWGLRPERTNPVRQIQRYGTRKIERFLSPAELARLGAALKKAEADGTNPYLIAAVRLLLFSGARKSEILTSKWDYFDAENSMLRLPDSKTGAKKVMLGAPALAVLNGLQRIEGNPYILAGHVKGTCLVNIDKFWRSLCRASGLENVRIHDLRHGFASTGAAGGDSLVVIGRLLGHSQPSVTDRYAHLAADPLKTAADRISGVIAAAMNAKPGAKVLSIKGAR